MFKRFWHAVAVGELSRGNYFLQTILGNILFTVLAVGSSILQIELFADVTGQTPFWSVLIFSVTIAILSIGFTASRMTKRLHHAGYSGVAAWIWAIVNVSLMIWSGIADDFPQVIFLLILFPFWLGVGVLAPKTTETLSPAEIQICDNCGSKWGRANYYCTNCGRAKPILDPRPLKAAVIGYQRLNLKRWWVYSLTLWGFSAAAYALAIIFIDNSLESSNVTATIAVTILMLICVVQTNLNARRLHDMGRSSRWPQILSYAILLIVFLEQMQNLHSDYETQIQRAHGLIATAFLFLWSIGSFVYGAICGFTRSDPKPNRWGGPRVALRLSAVTNVIGRGGEIFTHRRIRWPF